MSNGLGSHIESAENLLPDEKVRRQCLSVLADSILAAHQAGPSSWVLTLRKHSRAICFNIGHRLALRVKSTAQGSRAMLNLDAEAVKALPPELREQVEPWITRIRTGRATSAVKFRLLISADLPPQCRTHITA